VDNPEFGSDAGELCAGEFVDSGVELEVCAVPGELVWEPVGLSLDVCVAAARTLLSELWYQIGTPSPTTTLPFANAPTVTLPGNKLPFEENGWKYVTRVSC
jgi:hypothetical protein